MSAYYDLYETPSPDGKEDKKSLHARICPKRTYTQKEFVEHIATFQHLPKNVIGAALDACIDELCDLLANGNIVELGELGFFSTSLKCLRETDDEKKKIRSESVQFQNVHLRISSTFRNNIKKKMTLERVHSTTKKSKKVVETTEATRKAELELFLKQNVCINKNEYIQLSGLTRHAAIDELNKFIRKIGELLGISEPLTFYVARHSWATLARDCGTPLTVISAGMGHTSERTTRVYLAQLDRSVIDKANRKIINL